MPKKKKLKLANLSVNSFITSAESNKVRGREGSTGSPYLDCGDYCEDPVTDPNLTMTCPASCNGSCNATCYNTCNCESLAIQYCDYPSDEYCIPVTGPC